MSEEEKSYAAPEAELVESATDLTSDERNWGMACHLAALSGFLIPFGSLAGPLVVWLIKRNESAFIDAQGKEAVNFQITVAIAMLVSMLLVLVVIGFLLMLVVAFGALILTIVAAIKASNGEYYQYPLTLRLIK